MKSGKRYIAAGLMISILGLCPGCGRAASEAEVAAHAEDAVQGQEAVQEEVSQTGKQMQEETTAADVSKSEEMAPGDNAGQPEEELLEVPENGRRLTAEELQAYTAWLQERSNYGFLLSDWDDPTQIDLYAVFYNGAGISREGTEAEKKAFLDRNGLPGIDTDFYAMDKEAVSKMLFEKVGLPYDEMVAKGSEGLENWYDAEADSFCTEAGDTNYVSFLCTDGVINEEGLRVTLRCDGDDWVRTCEVTVSEGEGERGFVRNHILDGLILDREEEPADEAAGNVAEEAAGGCLIDESIFEHLHTDADASAVENSYVLGDWEQITKEALQGVWYHHPKDVGDSTEYDVVLQLDEQAAVYYPAVGFYGDSLYEWDIVDRSDRGLCPELAIYFRGTKEGELAWYILGISEERDYFWCNGEVFYRQ